LGRNRFSERCESLSNSTNQSHRRIRFARLAYSGHSAIARKGNAERKLASLCAMTFRQHPNPWEEDRVERRRDWHLPEDIEGTLPINLFTARWRRP